LECSEATKGGGKPEISVLWMSCSGWIICNIFAVFGELLLYNIKVGGVWSFYLEKRVAGVEDRSFLRSSYDRRMHVVA
jgi:hypothetical protein